MNKEFVTWEQIVECCNNICNQIKGDHFDKIIGITRGGAIPGVLLSHKLGINLYTIGLKTYDGETQTDKIEICSKVKVFQKENYSIPLVWWNIFFFLYLCRKKICLKP